MAIRQDEVAAAVERRLAELISDAEVARVHGHANFGVMSPREVINDGVRKSAVGYHCGHTQFTILREHGLITAPRGMSYDYRLTKKGRRYAQVLYPNLSPATGSLDREAVATAVFDCPEIRGEIDMETARKIAERILAALPSSGTEGEK